MKSFWGSYKARWQYLTTQCNWPHMHFWKQQESYSWSTSGDSDDRYCDQSVCACVIVSLCPWQNVVLMTVAGTMTEEVLSILEDVYVFLGTDFVCVVMEIHGFGLVMSGYSEPDSDKKDNLSCINENINMFTCICPWRKSHHIFVCARKFSPLPIVTPGLGSSQLMHLLLM